jgi:hypothetical protein
MSQGAEMTLIELRKLAEAATQGEWENNGTRVYLPQNLGGFDIRNAPNANVNAAYIAAVNPAAVISLLNQIQALQAENERLKRDCDIANLGFETNSQTIVALAAKLATVEAVSAEYNDWIRHHAGGGDFDGFLKLRHPPEEEAGADCTPNHNCNGRIVHLPIGEQCDKCGGQQ